MLCASSKTAGLLEGILRREKGGEGGIANKLGSSDGRLRLNSS